MLINKFLLKNTFKKWEWDRLFSSPQHFYSLENVNFMDYALNIGFQMTKAETMGFLVVFPAFHSEH